MKNAPGQGTRQRRRVKGVVGPGLSRRRASARLRRTPTGGDRAPAGSSGAGQAAQRRVRLIQGLRLQVVGRRVFGLARWLLSPVSGAVFSGWYSASSRRCPAQRLRAGTAAVVAVSSGWQVTMVIDSWQLRSLVGWFWSPWCGIAVRSG